MKDKKTINRILQLKRYLEAYFRNTNQMVSLNGIEFCQNWLKVLEDSAERQIKTKMLQVEVNNLGNDNHALEEIKYEFQKWSNNELESVL